MTHSFFTWPENMSKYLLDPRLDGIKRAIATIIRDRLADPEYLNKFYEYTDEWLDQFEASPEKDEQIQMILKLGFGPLSVCGDFYSANKDDHVILCSEKFRDPGVLGHWNLHHDCWIMAIFVYKLLQIMYPEREFDLVDIGGHGVVMEKGNDEIIYDIDSSIFPELKNREVVWLKRYDLTGWRELIFYPDLPAFD